MDDLKEKTLAILKDKNKALAVYGVGFGIVWSAIILSFPRARLYFPFDASFCAGYSSGYASDPYDYSWCDPSYIARLNSQLVNSAIMAIVILFFVLGLAFLFCQYILPRWKEQNLTLQRFRGLIFAILLLLSIVLFMVYLASISTWQQSLANVTNSRHTGIEWFLPMDGAGLLLFLSFVFFFMVSKEPVSQSRERKPGGVKGFFIALEVVFFVALLLIGLSTGVRGIGGLFFFGGLLGLIGFGAWAVLRSGPADKQDKQAAQVPGSQQSTPIPSAPTATLPAQQGLQRQDDRLLVLQQAVQNDPQSYEAWTDLAYRQHELDKNEDALTSANTALSLNKRYTRAWIARGAALSMMDGQEEKAHEALDRALIDDPNNVDALWYKGNVFVFQENDNAAHAIFDRILAINPRHKEALMSKGGAYMAAEDYNEALAVVRELIRLYPEDAVGWRLQGMIYNFQGEKKELGQEQAHNLLNKALASANRALEIDPADSRNYLLKAMPYAAIGDYGKAIKALNQGLKIDPNNTQLQNAKALIVQKRTQEITSRVARRTGIIALALVRALVVGFARFAIMFVKALFRS